MDTQADISREFSIEALVEYHALSDEHRAIYDGLALDGEDHGSCMEVISDLIAAAPCADCADGDHSDCSDPQETYQTMETGYHEVRVCCCGAPEDPRIP